MPNRDSNQRLQVRLVRYGGRLSYLVFDPASKNAMVIDPIPELGEELRSQAQSQGLHLLPSVLTGAEPPRGRESIEIGSTRLKATSELGQTIWSTPGFCWVGTGVPLGPQARGHRGALIEAIRGMDPSTLLLPADESAGILFSTTEVEKKSNPLFFAPGEVRPPTHSDKRFHKGESEGEEQLEPYGVIGVEKFAIKLKQADSKTAFVDVRESGEFIRGRAPGLKLIPLSEIAMRWRELASSERVYLSCASGRRSGLLAATLSHLGMKDVVNVSGGYQAWQQCGFPVETG